MLPTDDLVPFEIEIARLVSHPDFIRLQQLSDRPNLFSAIGRTFTETWHSCFMGWLLDPRGSHQLGTFPLTRFLVTVAKDARPPGRGGESRDLPPHYLTPPRLAELAILRDLSDATVMPHERNAQEKQLGEYGRADVWIEDLEQDDVEDEQPLDRFICILEEKVKANLSATQPKKYPDYLQDEAEDNERLRGLCVFLAPEDYFADEDAEVVIGDPRWYGMDFQMLYDGVLEPCARHADLHEEMKILLLHYMHNLRNPIKGVSMAVTREEKELAVRIKDRFGPTLRRLAMLLAADIPELQENMDRGQTTRADLAILVGDGDRLEGSTIPALFNAVLEYLARKGMLGQLEIPYGGGPKTYLVNSQPIHRSGRSFLNKPVEFVHGGRTYYMDTNLSREAGFRRAMQLLRDLKLDPRIPEG